MAGNQMRFEVRNRFTGDVQFTAEIEADDGTPFSIKIGRAVQWAYKSGANLRGADLRGAKNLGDFTMADGLKFSTYLNEVVPALLTAGGKTIQEIVASGAWECHSWDNCPMAVAFSIKNQDEAPLLYRDRVREFVQLYDSGLIPCPVVEDAAR